MRTEGIFFKNSPFFLPLNKGEHLGMMPAIAQRSTRTPWDELGNRAVEGRADSGGLEFPQTG
jgi:hypothetical protein